MKGAAGPGSGRSLFAMQMLRKILTNQIGATAAEYAIILAIIGAAIALSALVLSSAIANSMDDASSNIVNG